MTKQIKKFMTTIIVFLFVMFLSVTVNSEYAGAATAKGEVNADALNVRTGAGTNFDILSINGVQIRLVKGTKVTITEELPGDWYKVEFKYEGKKNTGYVAAMYVSPIVDKSILAEYLQIEAKLLKKMKISKKPSEKSGALTYKDKEFKLKKGTKVTVTGVRKKSGKIWYEISVKYKKEARTGFVLRSDAAVCKGLAQAYMTKKTPLYKKAGNIKKITKLKKKEVNVKKNKKIKVIKEKTIKKKKWFYIRLIYSGKTIKGWVEADRVMFSSGQKPEENTGNQEDTGDSATTPVILSDEEFEAAMTAENFPESYKTELRKLHALYPMWQFKAYNTGLDWNLSVAAESSIGKSLIPNTKAASWKSAEEGAYDYINDKYVIKDGTSWVCASTSAVAYYMDPRNFLNEKNIFMFESLSYEPACQTAACVAGILNGTIYDGASYTYTDEAGVQVTKTYVDTFIEAATLYGISPVHLASRMKQEVVTGATTVSNSVTGMVEGYEGIYNFYNIGSSDSADGQAVKKGLNFASTGTTYMRPWNNQYRAILGGAQYIAGNYVARGQNTLYLQRFNMTANNTYEHQYMTNVVAAYSESLKTYDAYGELKSTNPFVFYIPVYMNMPEVVSAAPSGNLNPNNYLKDLVVYGGQTGEIYAATPAFNIANGEKAEYVYNIPAVQGTINVAAQAVNAKAVVAGTGVYSLNAPQLRIPISVMAEDGRVRTYTIVINLI